MRAHVTLALFVSFMILSLPALVLAQDKLSPIVEVVVGRSSFIDEAWDHFTTFGAGARFFVTRRLAVGPEVAYLTGESLEASNLVVTGNVTFDFLRDDGARPVVPYFVAGGGFIRQTTLVGSGPASTVLQEYSSNEGTFSGGVGARIALGSHAFVAPEFRMGWEPTMRVTLMIGFRP